MRKEILIIPDVHGRSFWKEAVDSKDYEKIIFLAHPDFSVAQSSDRHSHT